MNRFKFNINNRLEVEWDEKYYKSSVMDVSDECITISVPMAQGRYIALSKGEDLEIIYYDYPNVYTFSTTVIGRSIKDNIPEIYVEHPKNIKKIQRRNHVRVSHVQDVNYCILDSKHSTETNLQQYNFERAIGIDISGGGMKLKTSKSINTGDIVLTQLINDDLELVVKGRIVRITKDEDNQNVCGVSFIDMDEKTEEKVIRFVFLLMRKQRKSALREG
ncbi:PilZ domain-containing protein [Clostridium sp. MSJ-4]|uniref:PilZ domain-containing protein n=1 Tax=Clostridium simiarum TaxID=2841506 RepID=A0ABS6EXV8_9CLOT|nr:PilZ domain-containing protein [Clostridium simiarum]